MSYTIYFIYKWGFVVVRVHGKYTALIFCSFLINVYSIYSIFCNLFSYCISFCTMLVLGIY